MDQKVQFQKSKNHQKQLHGIFKGAAFWHQYLSVVLKSGCEVKFQKSEKSSENRYWKVFEGAVQGLLVVDRG